MHCSTSAFSLFTPRWPSALLIGLLVALLLHGSLSPAASSASPWYVAPQTLSLYKRKPVRRWHSARRRGHTLKRTRLWRGLLVRTLLRTSLLAALLYASGWLPRLPLTAWLLLLPAVQLLARGVLRAAPTANAWFLLQLCTRLQRLYQLVLLCLLCSSALQLLVSLHAWPLATLWLVQRDEHAVEIEPRADSSYQVRLRGSFDLLWQPRDAFERWLLILFLRRLQPQDSKRPMLSQLQLADAFQTTAPEVSRWESQVRAHGWHVLSDRFRHQLRSVLPDAELSRAILNVWVPAFWLSAWDVRERLITLGLIADRDAVEVDALLRLAQHTGFAQVRELLLERFNLQAGQLIAKEQWWLTELLALNARLLQQLDRGERLSPQQLIASEPLCLKPPEKQAPTTPALAALHSALFEPVAQPPPDTIHCTYCDSPDVSRKSVQPRLKRILDAQGAQQWVAVWRYYCHNAACEFQTFTHFPAGVLPHSAYPVARRLQALEAYVNLLSTYRRSARALGLKASTLYQWLVTLSPAALHLAAYLGAVRTSGVIGLDDKWIKVCSPSAVPKHGSRPRAVWRYAYFAVDVYSLDLLALELYPEHNDQAVRLLLLALKARGIQPRVVVSDLDPAYARMLPAVFPSAIHHECIFHAVQNAQRQLTQVYGKHYRDSIPAAASLQEQIVELFRAQTQKTVRARFAALLALREAYVTATPQVACVFDSLATHFPKLVNAIESADIPRTNNTTELVIRRFDQHYQGMCGFDSAESARIYLRLFAIVYRLTPFAADNPNPRTRGQCPLALAGYDLSALPLAQFFSQRQPPSAAQQPPELVPMP